MNDEIVFFPRRVVNAVSILLIFSFGALFACLIGLVISRWDVAHQLDDARLQIADAMDTAERARRDCHEEGVIQ